MEFEQLKQKYRKSKRFESPEAQIKILEDFKTLTDSSDMPEFIKKRFKAVADKDIKTAVLKAK